MRAVRPLSRRLQSVLGRRYLLPLTTGATHWVELHHTDEGFFLACFQRQDDIESAFTPDLRGAHLVNNTTEKGPCIFLVCTNGHFEFQADSKDLFNAWLEILLECGVIHLTFEQIYKIKNPIGEGSFAKVYIGSHLHTNDDVVVKAIDKKKVRDSNVYTEIEVLRKVSHPYIIRLFAAYEKEDTICLVLEYLRGGELFDWLARNGSYTESQAKHALRRVLQGLQCLHQRGIVHRDLKTENLILEEKGNPLSLKIIDFGLASMLNSPSMRMRCGSPGYVAPEILEDHQYGVKVDVFSAGVILYTILVGYPPFRGSNVKEILKHNLECHVSFNHPRWSPISNAAMDLILWMTHKDPSRRCSAIQALTHPWFNRVPSAVTASPSTHPIRSPAQPAVSTASTATSYATGMFKMFGSGASSSRQQQTANRTTTTAPVQSPTTKRKASGRGREWRILLMYRLVTVRLHRLRQPQQPPLHQPVPLPSNTQSRISKKT